MFADGAEVGNVRKKDGDPPAFGDFLEFPGRGIDHIGDDAWVEKLAEGLAQLFLGLELLHHVVERVGQIPDFILGSDGQGIGQLSIGRFPERHGQAMESRLQAAGDDEKDQETQKSGDGKNGEIRPDDGENVTGRFGRGIQDELIGSLPGFFVNRVQIRVLLHF